MFLRKSARVSYRVKTLTFVLIAILLASCHRDTKPAGPQHHYPLSGKITALDAQHRTATVDAAAIPNYMEAMTMEYPIQSKSEFEKLRAGEQITATVDVAADESYALSNIKPASTSPR